MDYKLKDINPNNHTEDEAKAVIEEYVNANTADKYKLDKYADDLTDERKMLWVIFKTQYIK